MKIFGMSFGENPQNLSEKDQQMAGLENTQNVDPNQGVDFATNAASVESGAPVSAAPAAEASAPASAEVNFASPEAVAPAMETQPAPEVAPAPVESAAPVQVGGEMPAVPAAGEAVVDESIAAQATEQLGATGDSVVLPEVNEIAASGGAQEAAAPEAASPEQGSVESAPENSL